MDALLGLEALCFQPWRRASRRSLVRSLRSPRQSVWVVDGPGRLDAALVLWHFPHRLRVYDVATHPQARGLGLGRTLMAHAEALARRAGCASVSLEADPTEPELVPWYERQGYVVVARLRHFYGKGRHAVRMRKAV